MLEALQDCPHDICQELSWSERADSLCSALCLLSFDGIVLKLGHWLCFERFRLSTLQVLLGLAAGSVLITLGLYAYFVYVIDVFKQRWEPATRNKSNKID